MTCSSVNLDRFIVRPLRRSGLYLLLEEFAGLTADRTNVSLSLLSNFLALRDRNPRSEPTSDRDQGSAQGGFATAVFWQS